MSVIFLRDALLNDLKTLPGTREFHVHVLVSSPRKHSTLFQYARPRCRTYLQDILVLLSEQSTPDSPRILVTVIEACVYNIPATSCAILYVSKVDSTGQASSPSPTATLVKSFLTYHADPATRPVSADHFWIHVFARAQNQYLFPNSADYAGKHPLSDVKLCGWWKRVLTDTAKRLEERIASHSNSNGDIGKALIKLFYVLPGYSQLEAEYSLKHVSTTTSTSSSTSSMSHAHQTSWTYGHPYSQSEIPLACPRDSSDPEGSLRNLGNYIPSFDDDPKSRFLDEIAYTTESGEGIKSPPRKRSRTASAAPKFRSQTQSRTQSNGEGSEKVLVPCVDDDPGAVAGVGGVGGISTIGGADDDAKNDSKKDDPPQGELGKVTPDEFWERMSFRQECVAGAVTGFFTLGMTVLRENNNKEDNDGDGNTPLKSSVSPLAPQPGQVSSKVNKRVITSLMTGVEFSTRERAVRATEIVEGTIRGLCEGISTIPAPIIQASQTRRVSIPSSSEDRKTPERESSSSLLVPLPPRTPPPRREHDGKRVIPDVSPNPFPEPETSLETYNSYIYGSVCVSNPISSSGAQKGGSDGQTGEKTAPHVTVLTARKKKKRAD
ncbi:hypothetical protein K435DRAFT_773954 [Dendrothele bispora CBS 962.96]|uniref:histone acetyltransferase n=1 Tax=Dendrothele bispora (strain CBS 962.96) TaxID=1314807 RepID=A0A4S8MQA6_DENBC|nr:hypothetical protein K435DRAFT_773954 [Dendrothele bispora CBS 962.96]